MTSLFVVCHVTLLLTSLAVLAKPSTRSQESEESVGERVLWVCEGAFIQDMLALSAGSPFNVDLNIGLEDFLFGPSDEDVDFLLPPDNERQRVSVNDMGRYNVTSRVDEKSGEKSPVSGQALLAVSVPPTPVNGQPLVMRGKKRSDGTTRLTCGQLGSLGFPPAFVHWKDPEGRILASTGEVHGVFFLDLLPSSPRGTYACYIPCDSPQCCLADDSPLRQRATQNVITGASPESDVSKDCETPSQAMMEGMAMLVNVQVQDALRAQEIKMEALRDRLEKKLEEVSQHSAECEVPSDLEGKLESLEDNVQSCQRGVEELSIALAGEGPPNKKAVGFHARLSRNKAYDQHDRLEYSTVQNNEGDAFDPDTSQFNAPVRGVYLFIATVEVHDDSQRKLDNRIHMYIDDEWWKTQATASNLDDHSVTGTCTLVTTLNAGQRVFLQNYYDDTTYWKDGTSFSGVLIQQLPEN